MSDFEFQTNAIVDLPNDDYYLLDRVLVRGDQVFIAGQLLDPDGNSKGTVYSEIDVQANQIDLDSLGSVSGRNQFSSQFQDFSDRAFENGHFDFQDVEGNHATTQKQKEAIHTAIAERIEAQNAAPPEPERSPFDIEAEARNIDDPITFHNKPVQVDGVSIDGEKGYVMVDAIEFSDGKPYLVGSFAATDANGNIVNSREMVMEIDATRFPSQGALDAHALEVLRSETIVNAMYESSGRLPIVSNGEQFADRARLLGDLNTLSRLYGEDNVSISQLAQLGQENPEFVRNFEKNLVQISGIEGTPHEASAFRYAVLDSFGIEDNEVRLRLANVEGGFDEFHAALSRSHAFTQEGTRVFGQVMDAIKNSSRAARFAAGVAVAGSTVNMAAAGVVVYETDMMIDITRQQLEAGEITQCQHDALKQFHINTGLRQGSDMTVGLADQTFFISAAFTMGVELQARQELTALATEQGLSEELYQIHARSMFGGHTVTYEAALEAAKDVPLDKEGQPEILHTAIELVNIRGTLLDEMSAIRSKYGSLTIPDADQNRLNALEQRYFVDYQHALVQEMQSLMTNPDGIEAFLNIMSENDKLSLGMALARADDSIADKSPLLAAAIQDFQSGPGPGQMANLEITQARESLKADGGIALNDYIISRILPNEDGVFQYAADANASCSVSGEIALESKGDFSVPGAAMQGDETMLRAAAAEGLKIPEGAFDIGAADISGPAVAPSLG